MCALLAVPGTCPGLSGQTRLTLVVFVLATCAWIGTPVGDTYIALGAGLALTVTEVSSSDTLFGTLGDSTVWLLICAFVLAAAVSRLILLGARLTRRPTRLPRLTRTWCPARNARPPYGSST